MINIKAANYLTKFYYCFAFVIFTGLMTFTYSQEQPISKDNNTEPDTGLSTQAHEELIVDSNIDFEEAVTGQIIPQNNKDDLVLINVRYFSFDHKLHGGQLLVNKAVANDLTEIFNFIEETKFPINKVIPISEYNWSDDESMKDDNTSCFNYRFVSGTRVLSLHAKGLAIDINPGENPYIKNGITTPAGSVYDSTSPGTITEFSDLVNKFKERGWNWGGDWNTLKDYQHFQKEIPIEDQN